MPPCPREDRADGRRASAARRGRHGSADRAASRPSTPAPARTQRSSSAASRSPNPACSVTLQSSWQNVRNRSGWGCRTVRGWLGLVTLQTVEVHDGGDVARVHHLEQLPDVGCGPSVIGRQPSPEMVVGVDDGEPSPWHVVDGKAKGRARPELVEREFAKPRIHGASRYDVPPGRRARQRHPLDLPGGAWLSSGCLQNDVPSDGIL